MNLGRFHAMVNLVALELRDDKIVGLLSDLESALQQSISQANDDAAKNFRNKLSDIKKTLEGAASNMLHASNREILDKIGASGRIGSGLWLKIQHAISINNLTPTLAMTEIAKIRKDVNEFANSINQIDDAFTKLDIEYYSLDSGQFELGFVVPKDITSNKLVSLKDELVSIDYCVRSFNEIAVGDGASLPVSTISTSDWQIFLTCVPATAACVVHALEKIVGLYKSSQEIKLLKKQLEDKSIPEGVTKPLQEYVEGFVSNELRKIGDAIVDKYYKGDDGRKNELKNKLPKALRYLADRIDRGASIEVNARLPDAPAPENENKKIENDAARDEALQRYDEVRQLVEFVDKKMEEIDRLEVQDTPTLLVDYRSDE